MKHRIVTLSMCSLALGVIRAGATPVLTPVSLAGAVASESSDPFGFPASRAIDGNTNGWNPDFCHTNNGAEWWRLDLAAPTNVDVIRVFNRTDCCSTRTNGAIVNAFDGSLTNVYASAPFAGAPRVSDYTFSSTQSVKRVEVDLTGNYLSLAEVQLFTKALVSLPLGTNLSTVGLAGLKASQSSAWGGGDYASGGVFPPERALNGSTADFTHTGDGQTSNQWWKADLGETMRLQTVTLANRGDGCCPERLRDITLDVLDSGGSVLWTSGLLNPGNVLGSPAQIFVDIQAANGGNPLEGNQVRVTRTTTNAGSHDGYILALGEVTIVGGSKTDTDNDGMPDAYEIANGLNPNDPADAAFDPDGDTLINVREYQRGTLIHNPDTDADGYSDAAENNTGVFVSTSDTGTNPLDSDTDDDGLLDGVENNSGIFLNAGNRGTNPLKADTDGDTLSDGVENGSGTYVSQANPGTNPNLADTDGDTFRDDFEGPYGADPNNASSKPFGPGETFLLAYWPFDDASVPAAANDVVAGYPGATQGTYSITGGGHSGAVGDRCMQYTPNQVTTASAAFANLASPADAITITYWQKLNTVRNSSAFWITSPSSTAGERGLQVHTPWGNGNIYFDSSGCCDDPAQRLQGPMPGGIDVTEWHHFVIVKNGTHKEVFVDGISALANDGASPLKNDFQTLYIGGSPFDFMDGCIDDFAVFAGVLSKEQICRLHAGESPSTVLIPGSGNPFEITSVGFLPGNQIGMTWNSTPGCTYRVSYSTDLVNWLELQGGLASSGSSTSVELALPPGQQRVFFKVNEQ